MPSVYPRIISTKSRESAPLLIRPNDSDLLWTLEVSYNKNCSKNSIIINSAISTIHTIIVGIAIPEDYRFVTCEFINAMRKVFLKRYFKYYCITTFNIYIYTCNIYFKLSWMINRIK